MIPASNARTSPADDPGNLGRYPTPVQCLLTRGKNELWVKRDDLTNAAYGGNKVRKLERLLHEFRARGIRRIVTVGAAGSHHVLATTYFGGRAGLEVEAVLVPQARTDHAADVLRASVGLGLRPFPVRSWWAVPWAVGQRVARGATYVPLGGSNVTGAMGYARAAGELALQVEAGELPEPSICVVALGSGGTAAGLAAGLVGSPLRTRVLGVCVSEPSWALRWSARRIAAGCLAKLGTRCAGDGVRRRLVVTSSFIGPGYGRGSPDTNAAHEEGIRCGLALDPTYTAKAFAAALAELDRPSSMRELEGGREAPPSSMRELEGGRKALPSSRHNAVVLYWHTLSSAPLAPFLRHAPSESDLSTPLRELLV